VDFHFASHPGVTSTGWMGLRDPNPDLELEMREYTYEEAQKIPGMRVVDWHGCVHVFKLEFERVSLLLLPGNSALW
jgi:hypothetical protein